eukprot:118310-Chlamydomonas_euryale.AAC.3
MVRPAGGRECRGMRAAWLEQRGARHAGVWLLPLPAALPFERRTAPATGRGGGLCGAAVVAACAALPLAKSGVRAEPAAVPATCGRSGGRRGAGALPPAPGAAAAGVLGSFQIGCACAYAPPPPLPASPHNMTVSACPPSPARLQQGCWIFHNRVHACARLFPPPPCFFLGHQRQGAKGKGAREDTFFLAFFWPFPFCFFLATSSRGRKEKGPGRKSGGGELAAGGIKLERGSGRMPGGGPTLLPCILHPAPDCPTALPHSASPPSFTLPHPS